MHRLLWVVALIGVACGPTVIQSAPPTGNASPTIPASSRPSAHPSLTASPTASAIASPTASASSVGAALRFPTAAEVPLPAGRYSSQPPFDIAFTFDVPAAEWESGHLHGEFFDILRLESPGSPSRWIAFARPDVIHGQTDAPAAGLSAQEAIDRMATLDGLESGPITPFEIGGLTGVAADFRAIGLQVPLFGGPNGDFGLDSDLALRLGAVPFEEALLLALVLAPDEELLVAWNEAAPILQSVEFAAP